MSGHSMPSECLTEAEVKELREFLENPENPREEKQARKKTMFSKAGNCVFCKRAILKVFGT
jgi:hypothetical protein